MTTDPIRDPTQKPEGEARWCARCRRWHLVPFLTPEQLINQTVDRMAQDIADKIDREVLDELRKMSNNE